jgi:hypothetical protein
MQGRGCAWSAALSNEVYSTGKAPVANKMHKGPLREPQAAYREIACSFLYRQLVIGSRRRLLIGLVAFFVERFDNHLQQMRRKMAQCTNVFQGISKVSDHKVTMRLCRFRRLIDSIGQSCLEAISGVINLQPRNRVRGMKYLSAGRNVCTSSCESGIAISC